MVPNRSIILLAPCVATGYSKSMSPHVLLVHTYEATIVVHKILYHSLDVGALSKFLCHKFVF